MPERLKYGMSDWSIFESEKEKAEDFQPTKICRTKPSAPKGKQRSKLKRYCWKSISKEYICSENNDNTVGSFKVQWTVSRAKSAA